MRALLDSVGDAGPVNECACGEPATANGRECGDCFRERLQSVRSNFAPTRTLGAGKHLGLTAGRRLESRLEDYRATRAEGIQPSSTRRADIDRAKRLSDQAGSAF